MPLSGWRARWLDLCVLSGIAAMAVGLVFVASTFLVGGLGVLPEVDVWTASAVAEMVLGSVETALVLA